MRVGRGAALSLAGMVLVSGCGGAHGDPAGSSSPTLPADVVRGWAAVSATPAPRTHAVSCELGTSQRVTVRLRVPLDYRRPSDASSPCQWVAPDAINARVEVDLTTRTLAAEAARERNPVTNGQDAGNSNGSSDIRLSRGRVFGQAAGERLSYRSDDEGVAVRVVEARVAPLTLSMVASADGGGVYRSVGRDFVGVERSLSVVAR